MDIKEIDLKEEIIKIHKLVIDGLLIPKLTQTSNECNYQLRSELFALAHRCIMAIIWEDYAGYEFELIQLKNFIKSFNGNKKTLKRSK